jgi:hypothetical protein
MLSFKYFLVHTLQYHWEGHAHRAIGFMCAGNFSYIWRWASGQSSLLPSSYPPFFHA